MSMGSTVAQGAILLAAGCRITRCQCAASALKDAMFRAMSMFILAKSFHVPIQVVGNPIPDGTRSIST